MNIEQMNKLDRYRCKVEAEASRMSHEMSEIEKTDYDAIKGILIKNGLSYLAGKLTLTHNDVTMAFDEKGSLAEIVHIRGPQ